MAEYTVAPGRHIHRDGKRFVAIMRCAEASPSEADDFVRRLVVCVAACEGIDTANLLAFIAFRAKVTGGSAAQRMAVRFQWSKLLGDA